MKCLLTLALLVGFSTQVQAVDLLEFTNLSENDVENILEDFQTSFEPSTLSGAGNLGRLFGIEAGLFFGFTNADSIDRLGGGDVSKLPVAGVFGRFDTLYGIGVEATLLPVDLGDFRYTNFSFAGKWTFSKFIPFLPVSLRARLRYSRTDLEFEGNDGSSDFRGQVDNNSTSFDITVSKNLLLIEPYAGIGYVRSEGDFNIEGSNDVLGFTAANSVDGITNSGAHVFFGANLNLFLTRFGVEYSNLFGNSRYLAKFSVKF